MNPAAPRPPTRPRTVPAPPAIARHYDEVDPFYRALWGEHLHHGLWQRGDESPEQATIALVDRVARAAGLTVPPATPGPQLELPLPGIGTHHVVDIGCGYGAAAEYLADRYHAAVTGITLSGAQHAVAERRVAGREDLTFHHGDWLENDLPDGVFDAAIAIESTSHMADRARAFAEAARVLRPGGRLVVSAWLADRDASARQQRHLLRPICEEGRLASLETAGDTVHWIENAGFERVLFEDLSDQVARTWTVCLRRMVGRLWRPASWRYLLDGRRSERRFALTVIRMAMAYRVGCMRYGLFTAVREGDRGREEQARQGSGEGSGSGDEGARPVDFGWGLG